MKSHPRQANSGTELIHRSTAPLASARPTSSLPTSPTPVCLSLARSGASDLKAAVRSTMPLTPKRNPRLFPQLWPPLILPQAPLFHPTNSILLISPPSFHRTLSTRQTHPRTARPRIDRSERAGSTSPKSVTPTSPHNLKPRLLLRLNRQA